MSKLTIEIDFKIGQMVYLKTDPEQVIFMVSALKVESDCVLYELVAGLTRGQFPSIEISESKSVEYM